MSLGKTNSSCPIASVCAPDAAVRDAQDGAQFIAAGEAACGTRIESLTGDATVGNPGSSLPGKFQ